MIIVKLMGGHSNQLFQYAAGRRLALKRNTNLKLDLTWFDMSFDAGTTPRHYELDSYPISATVAGKNDLAKIEDNTSSNELAGRIWSKLARVRSVTKLDERYLGLNKDVLTAPDNTYLVGYWQNEKYFKDIREILLKEFEPTTPISAKNKLYLDQIKACDAISLHVRRGDYATNQATQEFHGLTSLDYYSKALKLVKDKRSGEDLRVFVFSTDMGWCKENLSFDIPTIFVEGNENGADDMRLMKHCKHNIMANSSFSWWGAWLNQNPTKIVIAPKDWFQDKQANSDMDNIPKGWIQS